MKKRVLSFALALVLVIVLLPSGLAMEDFIIENGVIVRYIGMGGAVVIPDNVTEIGPGSFENCVGMTSITIPNSVTEIGEYAFNFCSGLTSVTIPNSVSAIRNNTFAFCTGLTGVIIPESVTSIGRNVFVSCSELVSIIIPDSVTEIGMYAFTDCTALKNVRISNSVAEIRERTFFGCSSLTNTVIPNSVTKIYWGAFSGCSELTSVIIPGSVREIDMIAFEYCTKLKDIYVDSSNRYYTSVDGVLYNKDKTMLCMYPTGREGAFSIPYGVAKIGDFAFFSCKGLTNITIPDSVTEIGGVSFKECTGLTSVIIPNSVWTLGGLSFEGCTGLKSATISNGVSLIQNNLFTDCTGLTSVTIPDSVTLIIEDAFSGCINLTIRGVACSCAESFARENGIPFSAIAPTPVPIPALNLGSASSWARDGITSAVSKGFVPSDLQSSYTNVITRAEFCRMAVKWVEYRTGKSIDTVMTEKTVYRNPNAFSDTTDEYILAAYALGITSGTGGGKFTPSGQFNREQAAGMIRNTCRAAGMNVSNVTASGFADIGSASSWAVDGINFVSNAGIMSGTGGGNFSPKVTYTREQSIVTFNNINP